MTSDVAIHPTAVVEPGAVLGAGCRVGAYAVIGAQVVLGPDNAIGPHVVIEGQTTLGAGNRFLQFSSIGAGPQVDGWSGEVGRLEIGSANVFREGVRVNASTDGTTTRIGDRNLLMTGSHVGHGARLGDDIRMANAATLGGHVLVEDSAWISGLTAVHQKTRIGRYAFVAGGAIVVQDVPPFCTVQGDRARLVGLNATGLRRAGFTALDLAALKRTYQALFRGDGLAQARIARARTQAGGSDAANCLIDFLEDTQRGVVSSRRQSAA